MSYDAFVNASKREMAEGEQVAALPTAQLEILRQLPPHVQKAFLLVARAIARDAENPNERAGIEEGLNPAIEGFFGDNISSAHIAMLATLVADGQEPAPPVQRYDQDSEWADPARGQFRSFETYG